MLWLTFIFLFFLPYANSGAAFLMGCPACASLCIIPFNPACDACILALCVIGPITTACFSSDTKISAIKDGQIKQVPIYDLKENDLVISNVENELTKVVRNVKSEGIYDYTKILTKSGKELTITNEHGIIILDDESNKRIIKAINLREGQKLLTMNGPEIIENISYTKIKDKYILETENGLVIANNIYVSTICDDMIDEKKNADDLLKQWKEKHGRIYKKLIKN